jgi:hypothetical protein
MYITYLLQGISLQREISNSALVRIQIWIFAGILDPTCYERGAFTYAKFINLNVFDAALQLSFN